MSKTLIGRFVLYKGKSGRVASVKTKEVKGKAVPTTVSIKLDATGAVVDVEAGSDEWRIRFPENEKAAPPPPPSDTVWILAKPGEERRYTSAVPFAEKFAESMLAQGYEIIMLAYELPARFSKAGYTVKGRRIA